MSSEHLVQLAYLRVSQRSSQRKYRRVKERKTARELEALIEARMTVSGNVVVTGDIEGLNWIAIASSWGFRGSDEADRQAKVIAAELREMYELIDGLEGDS